MDIANYVPGAGMLAIAVGMLAWLVRNYGATIRRLERQGEFDRKRIRFVELDNKICEWRQSQTVIWMRQKGDPAPDFLFSTPEWADKERKEIEKA